MQKMQIAFYKGTSGILYHSILPNNNVTNKNLVQNSLTFCSFDSIISGFAQPTKVTMEVITVTKDAKYSPLLHAFNEEPIPGTYKGMIGLFFRNLDLTSKYLNNFITKHYSHLVNVLFLTYINSIKF
jgi:hypothetical protein